MQVRESTRFGDGVGSGVLEDGGGSGNEECDSEGEGDGSEGEGDESEGKGDDSDDDGTESGGLEVGGGGVGAGDSDEEDGVSEDGVYEEDGVCAGSTEKVVVTPLTIAETMPSGVWPRMRTSSPSSMDGNGN